MYTRATIWSWSEKTTHALRIIPGPGRRYPWELPGTRMLNVTHAKARPVVARIGPRNLYGV